MTRYIRYLVDVIGEEQKALYSYLQDRTNPYICLHGECQTLADWISVLLEVYNESFERWNIGLDLLVFDRLVNEMTLDEVPKQITDWYLWGLKDFPSDLRGRKYLHTVIEWDGLYWDANGGGTQRDKEEYYEDKADRKKLLHNFFDWDEMKGCLESPLVEESIDYAWRWTESFNREDKRPFADDLWIEEMGTGISPYENLGVFRDFINHLRSDEFSVEEVGRVGFGFSDKKIYNEVQRLHFREDMIRYEWGYASSGVYHSSVYDKGKLVGTIGLKSFDREELTPQCYDDFEWVLREIEWESNGSIQDGQIDKWVVFDVGLDEPYRNKGIGYKMYENIFKIKNNNPHTIIVGYGCATYGTTSYDAERVYKRLQRKYIGKGLVVSSIKKNSDEFSAETVPDWKIYNEVQRLHSREEDFYEGDIEQRIDQFREYELQEIPFELVYAPYSFDPNMVWDYALQINEYDAMCHPDRGDIDNADPICDITNPYPPIVVTNLYAPDPSEPENKRHLIIDGTHRYEAIKLLREATHERGDLGRYNTVKAWVGKGKRAWMTGPRDAIGQFIKRADNIYIGDEYGGFIKSNPDAVKLPGVVEFPGEQERIKSLMPLEDYENLPYDDVNLIISKLPYPTEGFTEEEIDQQHESIISTIVSHEYIHQSIDEEVLAWANENKLEKGDYYAAHEIMAYVDMAHRESNNMVSFKARLFQLVGSHPIITDNPELADRILDAMTRSRKGLKFQVPAEIKTVMQAFELGGFEILVVGGAVRDAVMGLTPKDYDLATNAVPNEVNDVIAQIAGYRVVSTPEAQLARGVLTSLVLPPSGEVIEITTFRAELGYEEGTRRPVAVPAKTFKEDSERRDFTMNALGWKLNGTILDYHDGLDDLEFGDLVSVGDANDRIKEDPLRILRAIRFHSRYGLDLDEDLSEAIGTHLNLLLTLSAERVRKELDSILKSEEGIYDLVNVGIVETLIPEYQGGYWGERNYDDGDSKFSFISDIQGYSMVDQPYPPQFNYTPRPWQPSIAYALLFKNVVTKEEFNEQYRRGPISFSRAEADMIAELIYLYPIALASEDSNNITTVVTSPYYDELMLMLEFSNRVDLVDEFLPYRQRYNGKPPKGYAMRVADAYSIEPSPALGDKISEITEAIILGDIEDWDEGLNYYAAEEFEVPEFVYHATPGKNLESIMEHGLEPRIGELSIHAFGKERYDEKVGGPKVWATTNNKARIYAALIAPMSYLEDNAILRIKTEGLDFKYYGFEEFFTDKHVPPSHIEHMYFIMGEKSEEDPNWTVDQQIDYVHDKYGACPYFIDGERHCFDGRICNYVESAAEEVGTRERIAYSGVMLNEDTSEYLLAKFQSEIPEDWTLYGHHMTVSLGKSIPNQADLGKEVTLTVTAFGQSDDAVAVAVSGYPSRNKIPHITLAIPPGGKPFNSNKITDWQPIEPFEIQGLLRDVKTYVAETFRSEAENNPSRLDIFYNWVEVDKKEIFNIPATDYNDRYDIANVVIAYQGTIKEKFLGDFPSVVYFYIWQDTFDETDSQSWYQIHTINSGWECRCLDCLQEGGPLFIDRQSGVYDISEYLDEDGIVYDWCRPDLDGNPTVIVLKDCDSPDVGLVRTLSIPITGMKVTKPQYKHLLNYLEFDFEIEGKENRWTDIELGSTYFSSKTNQSLRNLDERLVKNRMVTLNYPRNTWRKD
jgi:tRNA nucleotidyltransferase/poly(A) polymerase